MYVNIYLYILICIYLYICVCVCVLIIARIRRIRRMSQNRIRMFSSPRILVTTKDDAIFSMGFS